MSEMKKPAPTEFERFRDATKQILSVPKKEVDMLLTEIKRKRRSNRKAGGSTA